MDAFKTGPQTTELRILEHIVVYTDSVGSGLASGGTIKHQKPGEITYLSLIWANFFFLHNQPRPACRHTTGTFALEAKY